MEAGKGKDWSQVLFSTNYEGIWGRSLMYV